MAESDGIIMVYPSGAVANAWSAGRCCRAAMEQNIDDVVFVREIVEQLKSEACVDASRVYATGCSNGGGMAFRMGCDAADVIAGVAPVDFDCVRGPDQGSSCGDCDPGRPISSIHFRATGDSAVPYEGGVRPGGGTTDHGGAENNFSEWGEIDQCTSAAAEHPENVSCQMYPSCGGEVETTLCTIQGGSHCRNYGSFEIAKFAWERLQSQTLP